MSAVNGTATVTTFKYITPGEVWSLGIVLPVVATAIVALRFNARQRQKLPFGVDDWLILAANTVFIGVCVCLIIGVAEHVFGYVTPPVPTDLTTEELLNYLEPAVVLVGKLEFALQLLTVICYGLTKLSILAFYRQVFVVNKHTVFDKIVIVSAWVVFLWTITFILIVIFPCGIHVDNNWGSAASQMAHCLTIGYSSLDGLAASDFILDLFLICLPLPMIWRLRMKNSRKFAVSGIMLLGGAALGASITRLVLYVQSIRASEDLISVDFDEEVALAMYWSSLECGLAIIAACLPKLSYIVAKFSVQSAVQSVRSVFSLNSASRSQTSNKGVGSAYVDIEASSKASSKTKKFEEEGANGGFETYSMENIQRPAAATTRD